MSLADITHFRIAGIPRACWLAVAALIIKAAKIMEDLPEGTIDLGHMTADETADVFRALSVCTVLVCYVTQAELRRRGLM